MVPGPQTLSKLTGLYVRNITANLIGNLIIALLNISSPLKFLEDWVAFLLKGGWVLIFILILIACTIITILQYLIQYPISRYLTCLANDEKTPRSLKMKARQRLLNLPVYIALLNFGMWLSLDIIFSPVMYNLLNMKVSGFLYNFFMVLMAGLITSFIAFFLFDDFVRERMVPIFFPKGKLAETTSTMRISILKRIRVLFGVGTNAPMILLCVTVAFAIGELDGATVTTAEFSREIITFSGVVFVIFIIMSLSLNLLVANSILRPINDMINFVRKVRNGDFHRNVQVVSNDELGIMGDGMNAMTEGLLERDRLRRGLYLAQEVQQSLLPKKCPNLDGLDIAARSLYCDETGGDYFDFFENDKNQLNVVVGDVSGHGISSALLMASVRAFIRQRANLPGSMSRTLFDVNQQLVIDVEETGNFMTLFHLKIDPVERRASWIRGGHDPAIFYNPHSDRFRDLDGKGQALGISEEAEFEENERTELVPGQIIVLATDGVWEARNKQGDMFGKEHLYGLVRQHRNSAADDILNHCFQALEEFQSKATREDDITMVVVKIVDSETSEVSINP